MGIKKYNIDKFPHYTYEPSTGAPCIGCCCQCTHHRLVCGHPWHNGKSISTSYCYVCSFTYNETESFMLSGRHGIGCEMFEGNEEWKDIMLKYDMIHELKEEKRFKG